MLSTFKERFLYVLDNNDCSKSKAAEKLNVSPAYVSQLCSGVREPSDRTIADICRIFGVNRVWLETGVGDPFQPKDKREELKSVFADVLSGRQSDKNAFIEAVAQLPDDVFPVLVRSWIAAAEEMKQKLKEKE